MKTNELSSQGALKLYAAWYCPFAQRAWMGLLHKSLAFEYIEVDPYRKQPGHKLFHQLNRLSPDHEIIELNDYKRCFVFHALNGSMLAS